MMRLTSVAVLLFGGVSGFSVCTDAFQLSVSRSGPSTNTRLRMSSNAIEEYLYKLNEEKMQAIQALEEKQAREIDALKAHLARLKDAAASAGGAPATYTELVEKAELAKKLLEAQQFMAKYMQQLEREKNSSVSSASNSATFVSGGTTGSELYGKRSAAVAAAAAGGKSRWGDKEVDRAVAAAPAANVYVVPPEVEAADHGLRADGGVGGYTLAERVALGYKTGSAGVTVVPASTAATSTAAAASSVEPVLKLVAPKPAMSKSLFDQRNELVAAMAKAGKSRWGSLENERAMAAATK